MMEALKPASSSRWRTFVTRSVPTRIRRVRGSPKLVQLIIFLISGHETVRSFTFSYRPLTGRPVFMIDEVSSTLRCPQLTLTGNLHFHSRYFMSSRTPVFIIACKKRSTKCWAVSLSARNTLGCCLTWFVRLYICISQTTVVHGDDGDHARDAAFERPSSKARAPPAIPSL